MRAPLRPDGGRSICSPRASVSIHASPTSSLELSNPALPAPTSNYLLVGYARAGRHGAIRPMTAIVRLGKPMPITPRSIRWRLNSFEALRTCPADCLRQGNRYQSDPTNLIVRDGDALVRPLVPYGAAP